MSLQSRGGARCVTCTTQVKIAMQCAALMVLFGITADGAYARDRYRCIPADGSPTYTSPGTCRSADAREPLSEQEMADADAIKSRGRPFTRCTAADRSYSFHVHNSKECPSATDTRSTEYAKQPIERPREVAAPLDAAATALPPTAPSALQSARPIPNPSLSSAAPLASTMGQTRSETSWFTKLSLFALLGLGIWGAFKWLVRRSHNSKVAKSEQREARAQAHVQRRGKPAPTPPLQPQSLTLQPSDIQQRAQGFLAALDAGAEVPGGLAFRSALKQSQLDYSLESLDRIDKLLNQVRTQFSPQRESWQSQPGAENFCLLLAFYIGEVLSRQTKLPIQWHTHAQAAPLMPPDMPLPDVGWARVVGIIGTSACVPLGLIEDKLFDGPGEMTCKAYVERLASKMPGASAVDENQRCAQMLDAFLNNTEISGGLAYRAQLKLAQLDYSLASLVRLDQLLRFLRPEIKLTYAQFVNTPDTQNFLRWVAFYIGMTVARVGSIPVKWLDFAQAKQNVSELEFQFETTSICLLGGRTYFPLGLVTEILLQPDPQRKLPEWANQALQLAPPPIPSILQSSAQLDLANALDTQTALALQKAGFVAAKCMFMVEGGSMGAPTVFVPGQDNAGTFTDFSFFDSTESATAAAQSLMDHNPNHVPFQVMSFDGYANLHTGRTDALTIELRIYANTPPSAQQAFTIVVACPYRNAGDLKGFAIYSPKLLECSATAAVHSAIFKHFYLGIREFKAAEFDWFKYLDERI